MALDRVIVGKGAPSLDDLPQTVIQRLNGISDAELGS